MAAQHAEGRIVRPLRANGIPYQGINVIMLKTEVYERVTAQIVSRTQAFNSSVFEGHPDGCAVTFGHGLSPEPYLPSKTQKTVHMHRWPSPRSGGCGSVCVRGGPARQQNARQGREGSALPKPLMKERVSSRLSADLREGSSPHGTKPHFPRTRDLCGFGERRRVEPGPAFCRTRYFTEAIMRSATVWGRGVFFLFQAGAWNKLMHSVIPAYTESH
jgi:hypothetical protein